jgi:hypothetical protein
VVRRDRHSLPQVETMRIHALHAGTERQLATFLAPRFLDHPAE